MKHDPITLTSLRLVKVMSKDDNFALTANIFCSTMQDLIDELRTHEWSDEHILMAIQTIAMFNMTPDEDE